MADDATTAQLLDELTALLRRQIADVSRGDFEGVSALNGRVGAILGEVNARSDELGDFAEQVREVGRLRNQLVLSLAQQREETSLQVRHLRQGRKTLRAYRGA